MDTGATCGKPGTIPVAYTNDDKISGTIVFADYRVVAKDLPGATCATTLGYKGKPQARCSNKDDKYTLTGCTGIELVSNQVKTSKQLVCVCVCCWVMVCGGVGWWRVVCGVGWRCVVLNNGARCGGCWLVVCGIK